MNRTAFVASAATICAVLIACAPPAQPPAIMPITGPATIAWDGFYRTNPDNYGVVCYTRYGSTNSLSCVKVVEQQR